MNHRYSRFMILENLATVPSSFKDFNEKSKIKHIHTRTILHSYHMHTRNIYLNGLLFAVPENFEFIYCSESGVFTKGKYFQRGLFQLSELKMTNQY